MITSIEKIKRSTKYNVYVDGELYCCLSDFSILSIGLKSGMELNDYLVEQIIDAKKSECFSDLLNILASRTTEHVARQKLEKKGFKEEEIDYAVEKAKQYNYINDEVYAQDYVNSVSGRSKLRIKIDLVDVKGIAGDIVERALKEYDEKSALREPLRRELLRANADKQKLIAKFARQGFSYDTIKSVLYELEEEE